MGVVVVDGVVGVDNVVVGGSQPLYRESTLLGELTKLSTNMIKTPRVSIFLDTLTCWKCVITKKVLV